ncbi:NADH(P)-binding protein [Deinococcus irradiatisoli]|uniref:NADH(P)-binding protein n=1 Tax=Deinococcus irradiatisoli TaxID=2202254 RepID=A0A2Z3JPY3_9DEIO|nr:NAD-dependent epimerase/dehydratase family protein [Deinococcus irradiatisoli]AWN23528.1 NADH(P)-binding protein [Deinococcus irradiatisoli]
MTASPTSAPLGGDALRVLVTGASGFVGKAVVGELLRRGHTVLAGSREGQALPGAAGIKLDVTRQDSVQAAVNEVQPGAVVHLVGIIAERGEQTFGRVHVEGTRNVLAALPAGARYLHMSALGADPASQSRYSSTKGQAEQLVRASGAAYTIFQPSLIFGPGDDFFGRVLKNLVSQAPVVPQIGDGHFPFRPVSIEDVAAAFAGALARPETVGQTYALTGPVEYTFRELLNLELAALGKRKPVVPVPLPLMNLAVPLMQLLPNPPITKDQYAMLLAGNTADPEAARRAFDLPMLNLEERLPHLLKR